MNNDVTLGSAGTIGERRAETLFVCEARTICTHRSPGLALDARTVGPSPEPAGYPQRGTQQEPPGGTTSSMEPEDQYLTCGRTFGVWEELDRRQPTVTSWLCRGHLSHGNVRPGLMGMEPAREVRPVLGHLEPAG